MEAFCPNAMVDNTVAMIAAAAGLQARLGHNKCDQSSSEPGRGLRHLVSSRKGTRSACETLYDPTICCIVTTFLILFLESFAII